MERKKRGMCVTALSNTFRVLSSTRITEETSFGGLICRRRARRRRRRRGVRARSARVKEYFSTILRKNWYVYEDGARNIKKRTARSRLATVCRRGVRYPGLFRRAGLVSVSGAEPSRTRRWCRARRRPSLLAANREKCSLECARCEISNFSSTRDIIN